MNREETLNYIAGRYRREVIRIDPHTAEDERHHARVKSGVSRWPTDRTTTTKPDPYDIPPF